MSACPDHDTLATGRLKFNTQFPYLLNVHPDHADWRSDDCIWILILALWMSTSGRESTSSGRLNQSSLIWTWKKSEAWSNTVRLLDGLLSRLNGRKLEQKLLDTVKGPDRKTHHLDGWCFSLSSVQTVWHVVRTAGSMDRWASERLARNRLFWVTNSA